MASLGESGISDAESDDDYEPLIPQTSRYMFLLNNSQAISGREPSVPLPGHKIIPFSCYFCPKRKFKSLHAVHDHNKRNHRDICKRYSFEQWKCLKCNSRLLSFNMRGLMAHIVENRCFRRKRSRKKVDFNKKTLPQRVLNPRGDGTSLKSQTEFLCKLGLAPSHLQREGQTNRLVESREAALIGEPIGCVVSKFDRLVNSNKGNQQAQTENRNLEQTKNLQAINEKTPLKFPKFDRPVEQMHPVRSSRALYRTNTNVPRNTQNESPQNMRRKPKSINFDDDGLYNSILSTARPSALKAYERLCPKTFRRHKRKLRQTRNLQKASSTEVSTTVDENGRIVLRCESSYWSKVKNGEILA